jgi:colanic acid/amylovoran biosynthesis glycosyltransferase
MNLRLGYFVPEFPGQTHIFFWREIEALRQQGVRVHLISTKRPRPVICRHEFAALALAETHYLYPPSPRSLLIGGALSRRKFTEIRRYIGAIQDQQSTIRRWVLAIAAMDLIAWARRHRIEHIHGQSCANSAYILALANTIGGLPYSLTLHGDLEIYGGDHALKMKNAKFVSAVGQHLVEQLANNVGLSLDRIFSTFMGLDVRRFASIADNRKYDSETLRVVTVARLNQTKGHLYALEAVAKARDVGLAIHYRIIGEGSYRYAIDARIERLNLKNYVTLTGSLSEESVSSELAQADLFILPSFGAGEAWPVSVMEAMAAGLPVIATTIGATEEMIIDGHDGFLVAQRDSGGLFLLIAMLAYDPDLRERIGRNAREAAKNRFDVQCSSKKLLEAISR